MEYHAKLNMRNEF